MLETAWPASYQGAAGRIEQSAELCCGGRVSRVCGRIEERGEEGDGTGGELKLSIMVDRKSDV